MDIKENQCKGCGNYFERSTQLVDHQFNCIPYRKRVIIEDKPNTLEKVANQKHYTQFEIQPMEYCQRNKLGWCASNVVKYVSRENMKNGLEDLYKAMDYLRCAIHHRETGVFLTPDKLKPIKIEALE